LLINLVTTAAEQGATIVNYVRAVGLTKDADNYVNGVALIDQESGREVHAAARVVVNATGAFCDGLRLMAHPAAKRMVAPSQGTHLVFDRTFLRRDHAIMVPHTTDGRVMFAIPRHGHTLLGPDDGAAGCVALGPRGPRGGRDPGARAHPPRHHRCRRGGRGDRAAWGRRGDRADPRDRGPLPR